MKSLTEDLKRPFAVTWSPFQNLLASAVIFFWWRGGNAVTHGVCYNSVRGSGSVKAVLRMTRNVTLQRPFCFLKSKQCTYNFSGVSYVHVVNTTATTQVLSFMGPSWSCLLLYHNEVQKTQSNKLIFIISASAAKEVIKSSANEIILEIGSPIVNGVTGKIVENVNEFFKHVPVKDLTLE